MAPRQLAMAYLLIFTPALYSQGCVKSDCLIQDMGFTSIVKLTTVRLHDSCKNTEL